jgi:hypothetical protein
MHHVQFIINTLAYYLCACYFFNQKNFRSWKKETEAANAIARATLETRVAERTLPVEKDLQVANRQEARKAKDVDRTGAARAIQVTIEAAAVVAER